MNNLVRSSLKFFNTVSSFKQTVPRTVLIKQNLNIRSLCTSNRYNERLIRYPATFSGYRFQHTRSDVTGTKEMVQFLTEEINAERKLHKSQTIPSKIRDFEVHLNGSEVSLTKQSGNETIEVRFNINHSVSADEEDIEGLPRRDDEADQMASRPSFEVDIKRGNRTLTFGCSCIRDAQPVGEDGYNDLFAIDEITLYEGEWKETNYAVSGDVLDGYLYDLLMNYLDQKGISNDFVDEMCELSTNYEHSTYINFLHDFKNFISEK